MLDDGDREMSSVIHQARNIILWHFWKLLLENAFEAGQNDEALCGSIIVNHSKLYIAASLFQNCRLSQLSC